MRSLTFFERIAGFSVGAGRRGGWRQRGALELLGEAFHVGGKRLVVAHDGPRGGSVERRVWVDEGGREGDTGEGGRESLFAGSAPESAAQVARRGSRWDVGRR